MSDIWSTPVAATIMADPEARPAGHREGLPPGTDRRGSPICRIRHKRGTVV